MHTQLPDVYAPVPALFMTWNQKTTVHMGVDNRVHSLTASVSNEKMIASSIELFSQRTLSEAQAVGEFPMNP